MNDIDNFQRQVAHVFGINLPAEYVATLSKLPEKLLAIEADKQEHLTNFDQLYQLNKEEREIWPDADYAVAELPDSYFFIGTDGCGNKFAIDTLATEKLAYFEFDHEEGCWTCVANSLSEFAEMLMKHDQITNDD